VESVRERWRGKGGRKRGRERGILLAFLRTVLSDLPALFWVASEFAKSSNSDFAAASALRS